METDGSNRGNHDSALHNWGNGSTGGFIMFPWNNLAPGTNYDPAGYNTFGMRVTHDGGAKIVGCSYINNIFQRCIANLLTTDELSLRDFLILQAACDYWNYPANGCAQGVRQDIYVKSVRVWSCGLWATAQCQTSLGRNVLGATWPTTVEATQSATTAPGGAAAIKLTEETSNGDHLMQQTWSATPELWTYSINVAEGSGNRQVGLGIVGGTGNFLGAIFDPSNGSVVNTFSRDPSTGSTTGQAISTTSAPLTSGGFNISLTFSSGIPLGVAQVFLSNGGTESYTGAITRLGHPVWRC